MTQTCWQGMEVGHPVDWELAVFCSAGEPCRLVFGDRYYQRLDLRWKALNYTPNLDLMLEKYCQQTRKEEAELSDLNTAPGQWRGIVRETPDGTVVRAGRFFSPSQVLVEATLVWPEARDTALERSVLASICPQEPAKTSQVWQAMGIRLIVPDGFGLGSVDAKVGRVRWNFNSKQKHGPQFTIERLAMPEYWLRSPLRDWLAEQLPANYETTSQGLTTFNGHSTQRLESRGRIGALASLRGRQQLRLDLAWLCPVEGRLYHLWSTRISRGGGISLPAGLEVRCCQAVASEQVLGTGK